MGKQIKKKTKQRRNKNEKTCERCGNGGFTPKEVFRCKYCGWLNGVGAEEYGAEVTKGSLE